MAMGRHMSLMAVLFFLVCGNTMAQKIYQVMYENQCDVRIYLSDDEKRCDLKVVFVDEVEKSQKPGFWFVCDFPDHAEIRIFFVDKEEESDIRVFVVEDESEAGWANEAIKGKLKPK